MKKLRPIGRLVPNEPVGERESLCHLNKGDKPHEWKMMKFPVYSEQDIAAGAALRQARKLTDLTFGSAGDLLGLRPSEVSGLERGQVRFEKSATVKKLLALYRKHENPNRKPEPAAKPGFLTDLVRKAMKES